MNGHALKELARAIATVTHDGQSRQGAGEPYIEHPRRVAESERLWGWRQQALAWLHDTVEDADDPQTMIAALRVLFPVDIVDDIVMLSRLPDSHGNKEEYQVWIARIARYGRRDVPLVKLADLEDNLRDLRDLPPEMRGRESRYLRAKATLLDALEPQPERRS